MSQMDIDDCLVENARKVAKENDGHPYIGQNDWPKMLLDLCRIIDALKRDNKALKEAVHRTVKE